MGQTKTIHADGQSPLTQYLRFISEVPDTLDRVIDRDAEAVGILTAEPALPKVIERLECRYWDRQLAERFGEIFKFPRIWTRRDEHWVNWSLGRRFGWEPSRRLARYLNWLEPRVGVSHHDLLFQAAFNEARRDGTAAVVCPMLNQAYEAFDRHMKIARSILHDAGKRHELNESKWAVGDIVCKFAKFTMSPERDPTAGLVNDPTVNSLDDGSNAPLLSETESSVPVMKSRPSDERSEAIADLGKSTDEARPTENETAIPRSDPPTCQVSWDNERVCLSVDGVDYHPFTPRAKRKRLLFASFQELGWVARIDDPLQQGEARQLLRHVGNDLKKCNCPLVIYQWGDGRSIAWKRREQS